MEKFLIKLGIKGLLILIPFFLILFICLVPFVIFAGKDLFDDNQSTVSINMDYNIPANIPEDFAFKEIDSKKMIRWLNGYNSYLADEFHVNAVITAGRKYNLNALLLFAIIGQEQSFVPRSTSSASKIARNPFNVYHSWYEYSPGIEKSAEVAAGTVGSLSQGRPLDVSFIKWINSPGVNPRGSYAEDTNWWIGVSWFFVKLINEVGYSE